MEYTQPICLALLAIAMSVIAVCLVIISVAIGQMEKDGMHEASFYAHAMPRLVGHISGQHGDGRLQFLDPSTPKTSAAGQERTAHLALVDQTMLDLGVSHDHLDDDGKLTLYTLAFNTMRTEQILYNIDRLLKQTDVLLGLMQADMVDGARDTLFEMKNFTYIVTDYLMDVKNGKSALPVKLFA